MRPVMLARTVQKAYDFLELDTTNWKLTCMERL